MKLGIALHPEKWSDRHLAMARQLGCETVIAWVPFGAGDGVWHAEDFARIYLQAKKHGLVLEGIENFHPQHIDHVVLDEPGKDDYAVNFNTVSVPSYNGAITELIKDLERYHRDGYRVMVFSASKTRARRT